MYIYGAVVGRVFRSNRTVVPSRSKKSTRGGTGVRRFVNETKIRGLTRAGGWGRNS